MSSQRTFRRISAVLVAVALAVSCAKSADPRLENSSREDMNGWVVVHLSGAPFRIGFQHGWHLAPEIDDVLKTLSFYLERATGKNWAFYRGAAANDVLAQARARIPGGDRRHRRRPQSPDARNVIRLDRHRRAQRLDRAGLVLRPLARRSKPGRARADSKAPPYCSAFIATGSYTKDGGIVMGHNSWVEYIIGERWNAVLDIRPETRPPHDHGRHPRVYPQRRRFRHQRRRDRLHRDDDLQVQGLPAGRDSGVHARPQGRPVRRDDRRFRPDHVRGQQRRLRQRLARRRHQDRTRSPGSSSA